MSALSQWRRRRRIPCVATPLRIYTYELPHPYQPSGDPSADLGKYTDFLGLASETFYALREFFGTCVATSDPSQADYFFVPLNLILYQFRNEDPREALSALSHLGEEKNHLLVATGDFSNRSKRNHQGEAYAETYDWLDPFVLLAHESTSDLIEGQDIGVIPFNTVIREKPVFNENSRPLLYSFLGRLDHTFLPPDHVRSRLMRLEVASEDALITTSLDDQLRETLRANYAVDDEYELVSRNSLFTLAPAGYGRWTYRFFQAIAWGSIPVLISDDYMKPFAETIPYDSFSLTIPESDLDSLDSILRGIGRAEIRHYQRSLGRYQGEFTKRSFFTHLTRRLEEMRRD
jgi:Exostosin family